MIVRALLTFTVVVAASSLHSQGPEIPIVRDLLAPPSFFEDAATGKVIDPRKRLADEGVTFGKGESIAYDPVTSRLFVRSDAMTLLRLEKLFQAELRKGFALVALTYGVLETREPLLSDEPAEVPSLVTTRVLTTDEQVENLVNRAKKAPPGAVHPSSSLTIKSGETTEARIGNTLTRNVPVISADSSTIEMTLTLLHGLPGADPQIVGETRVALPSGSSVALEEWLGETSWRTRIITAVIVDPAGVPIPRKDMTGLPGAAGPRVLGLSLFPGPVPEPALEKVRSIIIPLLEFKETPLLEAIEILKRASIEHDTSIPDTLRGVNILFSYSGRSGLERRPVTLRLSNVPLFEAIRHTAKVAECDFLIEGGSVFFGSFVSTAPGEPEDLWYGAFLLQEEADELEKSGRATEALSKRQQAMKLYEVLREKHSDFEPRAVGERIKKLGESLGGK